MDLIHRFYQIMLFLLFWVLSPDPQRSLRIVGVRIAGKAIIIFIIFMKISRWPPSNEPDCILCFLIIKLLAETEEKHTI